MVSIKPILDAYSSKSLRAVILFSLTSLCKIVFFSLSNVLINLNISNLFSNSLVLAKSIGVLLFLSLILSNCLNSF